MQDFFFSDIAFFLSLNEIKQEIYHYYRGINYIC